VKGGNEESRRVFTGRGAKLEKEGGPKEKKKGKKHQDEAEKTEEDGRDLLCTWASATKGTKKGTRSPCPEKRE